MQIRRFPGAKIQIADLEFLIKQRLIGGLVVWPDQAQPLVGYMVWPNDAAARSRWLDAHRRRIGEPATSVFARRLKIIQQHWARVADIVHLHYDLDQGRHQERRGGRASGRPFLSSIPMPTAREPELPNFGRFGKPTRMSHTWSRRRSWFPLKHKPATGSRRMG
jgi:hypothetical protein